VTTQIIEYNPTEAALAELRTRLSNVVFDVRTTAGMTEARAARFELVKLRTSLEAKRVEIKAPALERCRLIDAEAARIKAELVAIENPIDAQIKAEERRREEEKAAAAAAERARVTAIQERIAQIRGAPGRLATATSALLADAITRLEQRDLTEADFGDWLTEATSARSQTLLTLTTMLQERLQAEQKAEADRIAQEAERVRIAAERAELAKLRAEQAARDAEARQQREAEEAAARARRQVEEAELARQRADIEARERAQREDQARQQREAAERERARIEAEAAAQRAANEAAESKRRAEAAEAALKAERDAEASRLAARQKLVLQEQQGTDAEALARILEAALDSNLTDAQARKRVGLIADARLSMPRRRKAIMEGVGA